MGTDHSTHIEVIGQLAGVGSLLLPCATQGLNSGGQAWWQEPLPHHPSCQLLHSVIFLCPFWHCWMLLAYCHGLWPVCCHLLSTALYYPDEPGNLYRLGGGLLSCRCHLRHYSLHLHLHVAFPWGQNHPSLPVWYPACAETGYCKHFLGWSGEPLCHNNFYLRPLLIDCGFLCLYSCHHPWGGNIPGSSKALFYMLLPLVCGHTLFWDCDCCLYEAPGWFIWEHRPDSYFGLHSDGMTGSYH